MSGSYPLQAVPKPRAGDDLPALPAPGNVSPGLFDEFLNGRFPAAYPASFPADRRRQWALRLNWCDMLRRHPEVDDALFRAAAERCLDTVTEWAPDPAAFLRAAGELLDQRQAQRQRDKLDALKAQAAAVAPLPEGWRERADAALIEARRRAHAERLAAVRAAKAAAEGRAA